MKNDIFAFHKLVKPAGILFESDAFEGTLILKLLKKGGKYA